MNPVEQIHDRYVKNRRVGVLAGLLLPQLPESGSILDVGAGDGALAAALLRQRPGLEIEGLDTLVRPGTAVPVRKFDGATIPLPDASVDYCLFVDVLHHTETPLTLLREAARVARKGIIIKDHLCEGFMARPTLRAMDFVGNARYGVSLPCNYLTRKRWEEAVEHLGMHAAHWDERLRLYPAWGNWFFGRHLHVLMRLVHKEAA